MLARCSKKDHMRGACGAYCGTGEVLVETAEGKRPPRKYGHRREDNIKMDLQRTLW
jgi:hypothetical protein